MRIVLDLQGCQNGSRARGIGRSSLALAKALLRQRRHHDVVLLLNGLFPEQVTLLRHEFRDLVDPSRILVFDVPGPVDEQRLDNDTRRIAAELLRERLLAQIEPDAVFVTSMVEGGQDDTVTSVGWVGGRAVQVALLHDLIPLLVPERYIGYPPARRWYMNKVESLRRCDLLLAVSDSARAEALQALGRSADDVVSISSSVDDKFIGAEVAPEALQRCLSRLGLRRPFLMHAGAVEPRKNFGGLLLAFMQLAPALRDGLQLVFVGKVDEGMQRELLGIAQEGGLAPGDLLLTGYVDDEELMALYSACRLFVYPSLHEGFGLPVLEAMHLGAPVIGSNRTSIPEVIGRADALFDPTDPRYIARKIAEVLNDPGLEAELRLHSRRRAREFSWDRSARLALAAIESAVAAAAAARAPRSDAACMDEAMRSTLVAPPSAPAPDPQLLRTLALAMAANDAAACRLLAHTGPAAGEAVMRWRLEGPFDSSYSLALVNRELARALHALGHDVTLHSTEGPGDFEASADFLRANPDLAAMHAGAAREDLRALDVQGRNLYPPRVSGMAAPSRLLVQYAWEETGLPAPWVSAFNRHLQGITCTSEHVHKVLRDNGVEVPIAVVGNGIDHWERVQADRSAAFPGKAFRFLHVSSCFPRKGVDVLLAAWGEAFSAFDDVTLLIKTFANPHNTIHEQIEALSRANPRFPDVQVIEDDLDDARLKALYEHCHVLVAPSRAEGFGLPLAEAMLSGLPVIATGWSGQLDFCAADSAWLVDYRFAPAESHFRLFGSVWAEPERHSLVQALRAAHAAPASERLRRAERGREALRAHWRWADVAARSVQAVRAWRRAQPRRAPRIGWVSTWNTRCGIATYSRHLTEALGVPVSVLAPHAASLERTDEPFVRRCWRTERADPDLLELDTALVAEGIDMVVLQFSHGFFRTSVLAGFIQRQFDNGRAVVVALHATVDPAALARNDPDWRLETLAPALARCDRVVVHAVDDLNRLKSLGLVENVALLPHPLWRQSPARSSPPRTAAGPSVPDVPGAAPRPPLIATFGFCLPHKGLFEVLDAAIALHQEGFPVRLRMLNAEFPGPAPAEFACQLRRRVEQAAAVIDVEFEQGFLTDAEVDSRLGDADLVVFAYQDTQESASGAVRHALAARRPVLVTPIAIFDDLGDAVHRSGGTDARSLAAAIRSVLGPQAAQAREAVEAQAARWRQAHDVGVLAPRLLSMLRGLWNDRPAGNRWWFDGSSRMLRSAIGRVDKRLLRTTGVAGAWVRGPYIPLRAGRHRLTLAWEGRCPAGVECLLRLVCRGGATELAVRPIAPLSETRHELRIEFESAEPLADLEVTIEVDAGAELALHGIGIEFVGAVIPHTQVSA